MKVKVTIEEIISQQFEVEVENEEDVYEEVRRQYRDGEIVLTDSVVTEVNILIGENGGWENLHV